MCAVAGLAAAWRDGGVRSLGGRVVVGFGVVGGESGDGGGGVGGNSVVSIRP